MVEFKQVQLESLKDPRIAALARLGGGELVETFLGTFEGQPAFVINDYVAFEFGEADAQTFAAYVFETEAARSAYLDELAERSPLMAGRRPPYWTRHPPTDATPEGRPNVASKLARPNLLTPARLALAVGALL